MCQVMPYEKFEYIMKQIQEHEKKRNKISDFFEEELCTDSWCFINFGEDIVDSLTCLLADHFNCWYRVNYSPTPDLIKDKIGISEKRAEDSDVSKWWDKSFRRWDNDIEYWLYEENKKIEINKKEIPIKTLKQFYNYLVKYCVDKKDI